MTQIFNKNNKKELRKKLRNEMPSAEKVLWQKIRKKQIHNHRFRRQVSIGTFVVDFYCPELNLVIEADGANHFFDEKSENYDTSRQKYLE
ncbi:DUF559 domain-containing protein, partial [Candidatus Falkowbacteria bacterium]|nr:DUF559 domain-containing protein [Candidatus Falkowbacteria bacterium]